MNFLFHKLCNYSHHLILLNTPHFLQRLLLFVFPRFPYRSLVMDPEVGFCEELTHKSWVESLTGLLTAFLCSLIVGLVVRMSLTETDGYVCFLCELMFYCEGRPSPAICSHIFHVLCRICAKLVALPLYPILCFDFPWRTFQCIVVL